MLTLQTSLESNLKESTSLKRLKEKLNGDIVSLKRDREEVCEQLEESSLQLNKTSTQLANVESRCKVCMNRFYNINYE